MKFIRCLMFLLFASVMAAAESVFLRPNGDVQTPWKAFGCTSHFDCVNEPTQSHDGDATLIVAAAQTQATEEYALSNVPGNFDFLNTATLRVVIDWRLRNFSEDWADIWLEVGGVQIGAMQCYANNSYHVTPCSCASPVGTFSVCEFSDNSWNMLTKDQLNNATFNIRGFDDPLNGSITAFGITAVEVLLDYTKKGQ